MKTSTYNFVSDDGTPLFVYRWEPDGLAKAIVHIAHGLEEHAARYARVAEALTSGGYLVFAHDHRGHGRTVPTERDLGHFADKGGWNRAVRDLQLLIEDENKQNPGLPLILLGHSMGSFMAQQLLYESGNLLQGCVLSGSNGSPQMYVPVLKILAYLQRLIYGRRARSKLLHTLSLKTANRAFQPVRTNFDWLTRDIAEVDKFVADPLCGWIGTTQIWIDLLYGASVVARPENRALVPKHLPIYILAGTADPVSNGCEGLEQLISAYQREGITNVRHKFYPGGRHGMLNEINRDEVVADLITWLNSTVGEMASEKHLEQGIIP